MIDFLNLIRWKNLLLIALVQILIKYSLFLPFDIDITLNGFGFSLLVIATICIAAAGNVINDVYDVETDTINRPEQLIVGRSISEKTALNLYIILTVTGVGIGFYLSNLIGRTGFAAIFVIVSALLYVYATYLKSIMLIGNLAVSALVALSILIVGIYELLPVIDEQNRQTQLTFFEILLDYAAFAFLINLLREMVKDVEDIDGDFNAGMKTLPIVVGRIRASKIIFGFSIIPIAGTIYYLLTYLYKQQIAVVYFLIFIVAPLIYFCVKSFNASTKKEWHHLSKVLKLVMLFGVLSLALYKYILLP